MTEYVYTLKFMCIIFESDDTSLSKVDVNMKTYEYINMHPNFLYSVHTHPLDLTICKNTKSFYVKWFKKESQGHHDTVSVTDIVSGYVNHRDVSLNSVDKGRGRHIHAQIDLFLNGCMDFEHLVPAAKEYYMANIHTKLIPWRTEMPIRSCEETRIVGIVDALFMEMNNNDDDGVLNLHLKDWKVSADISTCIHAYCIQLGIYKYILEQFYQTDSGFTAWGKTYTSIKITTTELVVFHPSSNMYTIHSVDNTLYEPIIKEIFENRKKKRAILIK